MTVDGPILGEALLAGTPVIAVAAAEELVARRYGIRGRARRLAGEKDSNFLIRQGDGRGVLLKIVHPGEDRAVTAMQTSAFLHVARVDPDLPVQRVIPTVSGEHDFRTGFADGTERAVRLVSFAEGVLQGRSAPSAAQRRNIGAALARLQRALQGFSHPADSYTLVWDLKHAAALRPALQAFSDPGERAMLHRGFDAFEERLAPRLTGLRTQVVHNDLNGGNVVVDEADPTRVRGLLDFGDMVRTAVAIDVGVGAAYQLSAGDDPLSGALDFLEGFAGVKTLQAEETDLLFDLIVMRLVVRLVILTARAAETPEKRHDLLRDTPLAWAQLRRLTALPRQRAVDAIGQACARARRS